MSTLNSLSIRGLAILTTLSQPREGQTTTELGAVLVFVSIVAVAILRTIGGNVASMISPLLSAF